MKKTCILSVGICFSFLVRVKISFARFDLISVGFKPSFGSPILVWHQVIYCTSPCTSPGGVTAPPSHVVLGLS